MMSSLATAAAIIDSPEANRCWMPERATADEAVRRPETARRREAVIRTGSSVATHG